MGVKAKLGSIRRHLGYLTQDIRRFGLIKGFSVYRVSRLDPAVNGDRGDIKVSCGDGQFIVLRAGTKDVDIFEQIFVQQDCRIQFEINPSIIIDGGAHIGCAARFFAQQYPSAKIIAVEAEESNFEQLKKNVADYPKITPLHAAIWNEPGIVTLREPGSENWSFSVRPMVTVDPNLPHIKAMTIKELITMSGATRVGLLKLDIEGAEHQVFSSDDDGWIEKIDAMVIELHDRYQPGCSETFNRRMQSHAGLKIRYKTTNNVMLSRD